MVLTRSQTNKKDDEDRSRFLLDEPAEPTADTAAGGARRKDPAKASLGKSPQTPTPKPSQRASDTFVLESPRSPSADRLVEAIDEHFKRNEERLKKQRQRDERLMQEERERLRRAQEERSHSKRAPPSKSKVTAGTDAPPEQRPATAVTAAAATAAGAAAAAAAQRELDRFELTAPRPDAPRADASRPEAPRTDAPAQPATSRNVAFNIDASRKSKQRPPPSERSAASSTTAARRREAEFLAAKKMAEIERRQLQIEKELIEKQLAAEVARIEEEGSLASGSQANDSRARVSGWLEEHYDPGAESERKRSPTRKTSSRRRKSGERRRRSSSSRRRSSTPRHQSPTKHRSPSPRRERESKRDPPSQPRRVPRRDRSSSQSSDTSRDRPPSPRREPKRNRALPSRRESERDRASQSSRRESPRYRLRELSSERSDASPRRTERRSSERDRRTSRGRRSSSRWHQSSREDIDRLTDHMQSALRPPPKQVYELPAFNGEPGEWLTFFNSYEQSTKRYSFSNYENIARLRYALKGEARQCVQHMLAATSDPALIMRVLKKNFGRTDLLIDRALDDLRKLPVVGPSATDLNTFAIKVTNIISTLVGLDQQTCGANPLLIREITERLSPHLRSRWCSYAKDNRSKFKDELSMMAEFLLSESDAELLYSHARAPSKRPTASTAAPIAASNTKRHATNVSGAARRTATHSTFATQQRAYAIERAAEPKGTTCLCCGGAHKTPDCRKLQSQTVGARWDWARQNHICYKCLNSRHRRELCRAKGCGEPGCPHTHHRLLHEGASSIPVVTNPTPQTTAFTTETSPGPSMYSAQEQTFATSSTERVIGRDVLLKLIPVIVSGPKGELMTHALLDEGSTISLIDQGLADAIGIAGPVSPLDIKGVGSMRDTRMSQTVSTALRGIHGGNTYSLTLRTVRGLGLRGQTAPQNEILAFSHMKGMEHACYEYAQPYILIGADHWHLMVPRETRLGGQNEPAALRIDLGWVIYGVMPRIVRTNETAVIQHFSEADRELNSMLKQHFSVDSLGVSSAIKTRPEIERAQRIFDSTVRRIPGPRYEVGQLWKTDDPELPPNYLMALRRLKNLEAKMDRNKDFAQSYTEQVNNLLAKGYAVKLEKYEPTKKDHFLAHFAVTNPNKPGKLRMVFDAAAQVHGKSLNDYILEGPDLLQSLPGILFRFRENKYGCSADLQEMFLQIYIREEDRPSQMFLWRGTDRKSAPSIYSMRSMIFGAASSPFIAHSVRNLNAENNKNAFPLAVNEIKCNHYMDDFVSSFSSKQECLRVASEVAASHAQGGFTLRGWASNCDTLMLQIPEEMKAKQPTSFGENTDKILGMLWDANSDELAFNTRMLRVPADVRNGERGPTKREMLSAVMSVFDPLGLISQYVISAKIQLQRLWALNIGWDDPLPDTERREFEQWLRALHGVAALRVPRQYFDTGPPTELGLHVFVDASAQAYAVAAYWRAESPNGVAVSLVAAKAKVAPTKPLSIPRLELQAALIGARLQQTIRREHRLTAKQTTLWSDSKIVLRWIRDDARRYNTYVAHRLGEIAEITDTEQWRWVPTKLNPADDGTRADPGKIVSKTDRWYQGPAFLRLPQSEWPQETNDEPIEPIELKKSAETCNALTHENPPLPDITRFSDHERLIRATARVLQFIERIKGKKPINLELRHIQNAEHLWLQHSQRTSFPEEMRSLSKGETVRKSSKMYKLDPVLGEDGVIRMRTRINAAPISNQSRKPAILDGRDSYVRLLIARAHKRALHGNNERIVNDLRQSYWIIHLRPSVRAVAIACRFCALRRATPQVPSLGDLPAERVKPYSRPFTYAAVDYMGPVTVTIGRRHEKRWIALFTCLCTRAVHLEIVASLSTDSAIMALRRMGARRGYPKIMYSDNATCFRGADTELRAAFAEWLPALRDYGLTERMQWRFIPPGAPNQGGAWERLVRSVKVALAATLHTKAPREEVLHTVLAEAEHSVNARPLTHVSVDPRDPEALTPHHFLLGGSTGLPETGPCDEADRRTWRATQALSDHFWARWVREYLPTLAPRRSSNEGERQLQKGDYVIIVDPSLPRNVWPRGIVETTYPGPDGVVRSADVRTKGGVFRRPTRKLAVLPVQSSGDAARAPGGENVADSRDTANPSYCEANKTA